MEQFNGTYQLNTKIKRLKTFLIEKQFFKN